MLPGRDVANVAGVQHFASNRPGLKLIVAYKLCKSVATGILAAILLHVHAHGGVVRLAHRLAVDVSRWHLAGLGDALSQWLTADVTSKNVGIAALILLLDTASTAAEGIGLHYRQRWAAWWVVVATGALIPLELHALVHHPTVLRAMVLAVNLAIVAYLVWRVLTHHGEGDVSRESGPA
ncbi:MAG: DUF2127 domain-containing protein [Deltaproteobacteria bacterium]|nr:DUF2127 domain-containing protein [Deltaproteobacteria bacterium]